MIRIVSIASAVTVLVNAWVQRYTVREVEIVEKFKMCKRRDYGLEIRV
jgi:hypothetical protein